MCFHLKVRFHTHWFKLSIDYSQKWYSNVNNLFARKIQVNLTLQISWERCLFRSRLERKLGQCMSTGLLFQNTEASAVNKHKLYSQFSEAFYFSVAASFLNLQCLFSLL